MTKTSHGDTIKSQKGNKKSQKKGKRKMWTKYYFEDGTITIVRKLSANEKKWEILKHGKIIKVEKI